MSQFFHTGARILYVDMLMDSSYRLLKKVIFYLKQDFIFKYTFKIYWIH